MGRFTAVALAVMCSMDTTTAATAHRRSFSASLAVPPATPHSLAPARASAGLCAMEQAVDRVFGEGHYSELTKVRSADTCCGECYADSKCMAYTYALDTKTCYLKDSDGDGGTKSERISGRKNSPSNATCTLQTGVEYLGNDVGPAINTTGAQDCCNVCSSSPKCQFFTYEGDITGLCRIKNANAPDYSRQTPSATSGFVGASPPAPPAPAHVKVTVGKHLSTTGPAFVCWNIDASPNRGFFWRNLSAGTSYGAQLAKQAKAISDALPAGQSLLRFGGSGNDYLTYNFGGTPCPPDSSPTPTDDDLHNCLNQTVLQDLFSFAEAAGARIIFGLSMNTGRDMMRASARHLAADEGSYGIGAGVGDGDFPYPWDPSNAKSMLEWVIDHGYDHLLEGFELGNEQNAKYTPEMAANGMSILHNLTIQLWPDESKRPGLYGPDPHSFHDAEGDIAAYIVEWLDACRSLGVPIRGATHHEYIEVDADSFTSPDKLDLNGQIAAAVNASVRAHNADVRIMGGEIGPHNGGSPPCDHTSMRWANFGTSIWYADALASKAKNGYDSLCRQDYIGADYGMVDCSTGVPLPDYYTGLVWASVMGRGVLDASVTAVGARAGHGLDDLRDTNLSSVRVYAHCTRLEGPGGEKVQPGSVTVLVINLSDRNTTVEVDGAVRGADISMQYVLSPSADPTSSMIEETGLLGTGITLNGKLLKLDKDGAVPSVAGEAVGSGQQMHVPPTSIAFFVLENAGNLQCMQG